MNTENQIIENLDIPVSKLPLSSRVNNLLVGLHITYVGQLIQKTEAELLKTKNFGHVSLAEIEGELEKLGLGLGTHINYVPPQNRTTHLTIDKLSDIHSLFQHALYKRKNTWQQKYTPAVIEALDNETRIIFQGLENLIQVHDNTVVLTHQQLKIEEERQKKETARMANDFYKNTTHSSLQLDNTKLVEMPEEEAAVIRYVAGKNYEMKKGMHPGKYHHTTISTDVKNFIIGYNLQLKTKQFEKGEQEDSDTKLYLLETQARTLIRNLMKKGALCYTPGFSPHACLISVSKEYLVQH